MSKIICAPEALSYVILNVWTRQHVIDPELIPCSDKAHASAIDRCGTTSAADDVQYGPSLGGMSESLKPQRYQPKINRNAEGVASLIHVQCKRRDGNIASVYRHDPGPRRHCRDVKESIVTASAREWSITLSARRFSRSPDLQPDESLAGILRKSTSPVTRQWLCLEIATNQLPCPHLLAPISTGEAP